jgi:tricorn protease interacting factor F2/3
VDTNPINYDLIFEPNLKKFTFNGKETITIDCKKATKIISLHCSEIKINSCQVKSKGKIINSAAKTNEKKEELQITLKEKIKGKASIIIEFQGILNDRLLGFYRSQYQQGGKTKYLATTQFEAAERQKPPLIFQ